VIKGTTCLRLKIPGTKLVFKFLVTSLLLVEKHTNRQGVHKDNITPNMRTNSVRIFYAMLQECRFENHYNQSYDLKDMAFPSFR
jgi:hypothetical protein